MVSVNVRSVAYQSHQQSVCLHLVMTKADHTVTFKECLPSSKKKHQQKYCPLNYSLYGHTLKMNGLLLFCLNKFFQIVFTFSNSKRSSVEYASVSLTFKSGMSMNHTLSHSLCLCTRGQAETVSSEGSSSIFLKVPVNTVRHVCRLDISLV